MKDPKAAKRNYLGDLDVEAQCQKYEKEYLNRTKYISKNTYDSQLSFTYDPIKTNKTTRTKKESNDE